jgi:shikimate 5-dehydrogenase
MRNELSTTGAGGANRGAAFNQELQMQTRIAILETREKQMNRKLETAMTILNHSNQSQIEVSKQYDILEKRWNELTE